MLEALRRLMIGDPAPPLTPAADLAGDLQHIEQVLAHTQADLVEVYAAVDHYRAQLAAVDARSLWDREDPGDDMDAESWREQLSEGLEDIARLTAALPRLEEQQNAAKMALKAHRLSTGLNRIDGYKREYGELATVLSSPLSSAADTAAQMGALVDRIETGRSQAMGLQVEMGFAPSGISFTATDVRALWVTMLAKARTRPAAMIPAPPPIPEPPAAVTACVTTGTNPEARTWSDADGHRWERTTLPSPATCQHRVGNKSAEGAGCGEPATMLARSLMPSGEVREWPYCAEHARPYAAAHHLTMEGA